jgi:hypothetical protein
VRDGGSNPAGQELPCILSHWATMPATVASGYSLTINGCRGFEGAGAAPSRLIMVAQVLKLQALLPRDSIHRCSLANQVPLHAGILLRP